MIELCSLFMEICTVEEKFSQLIFSHKHTCTCKCSTLGVLKGVVEVTANSTSYESYDLENKYMKNIYNRIFKLR